jgi:hypothetical protein
VVCGRQLARDRYLAGLVSIPIRRCAALRSPGRHLAALDDETTALHDDSFQAKSRSLKLSHNIPKKLGVFREGLPHDGFPYSGRCHGQVRPSRPHKATSLRDKYLPIVYVHDADN